MEDSFRSRTDSEDDYSVNDSVQYGWFITLGWTEACQSPEFFNSVLEYDLLPGFGVWNEQLIQTYPRLAGISFLVSGKGEILSACQMEDGKTEHINIGREGFREDKECILKAAWACCETGRADFYEPVLAAPIYAPTGELFGVIGIVQKDGVLPPEGWKPAAVSLVPCIRLVREKRINVLLTEQLNESEREVRKLAKLKDMAESLFTHVDTNSVLMEIIRCIQEVFAGASVELYLSQDHREDLLPVKPLHTLHTDSDVCYRAFMAGRTIHIPEKTTGIREIGAPLRGKQGVYGVFRLQALNKPMERSDLQLIDTMIGMAGSAFENTRLFEQSNIRVNELSLLNEMTKRLNQSLRVNEIFSCACEELLRNFKAEFCCILQKDRQKNQLVVRASNMQAMFNEQFPTDYGFSGVVHHTLEPIIVPDYWQYSRINSKLMELSGSRSLLASPIFVDGDIEGVIIITHRLPHFFTYENYKLLRMLAGHIGIAIKNASLHAEVRRKVITDHLTGLYTRRHLNEQVVQRQTSDDCGSLIVVDIDNFKSINDTFGHQVGDQILIQVSGIVKSCIRDTDIAARWGGEELAIYLPDVKTESAIRITERIRSQVLNLTNPQVTVSCGIADWHAEDEKISIDSLFHKSDMALYQAKQAGKNQIKIG